MVLEGLQVDLTVHRTFAGQNPAVGIGAAQGTAVEVQASRVADITVGDIQFLATGKAYVDQATARITVDDPATRITAARFSPGQFLVFNPATLVNPAA